jgi:hypothetical protein
MNVLIPADTKLMDIKWQKPAGQCHSACAFHAVRRSQTAGPYVMRIRVPTLIASRRTNSLTITWSRVLKGTWWHGDGERYDRSRWTSTSRARRTLRRAGSPHFDFARTEVVLEVMGNGPVENPLSNLNPDEDPRNNDQLKTGAWPALRGDQQCTRQFRTCRDRGAMLLRSAAGVARRRPLRRTEYVMKDYEKTFSSDNRLEGRDQHPGRRQDAYRLWQSEGKRALSGSRQVPAATRCLPTSMRTRAR